MRREVEEGHFRTIHEMKGVNRLVVFDVLEKIRADGDEAFFPMLEKWKKTEVRKVRERIGDVEKTIERGDGGPVFSWLKAPERGCGSSCAAGRICGPGGLSEILFQGCRGFFLHPA